MSEIEITEDNCVLSYVELNTISELIANHVKIAKHERLATDYFNKVLQKIKKLNDLAKEWQNKKLVLVTQEFIDDIKKQQEIDHETQKP